MAVRGLEGIDETVQRTYAWIDDVAAAFHGDRHHGLRILRAFLHLVRDHLSTDEGAQLSAQLPMLVRGMFYEGWDPSKSLAHERSASAFLERFIKESGVREMDSRDAIKAAAAVMHRHISAGEADDVYLALPAHIRELLG